MAQYNVTLERTLSTTASIGTVGAPGSSMRRGEVVQLVLGVEGTPGDTALKLAVQRYTAAGTSTAVTPNPRDPADAACVSVAGQNHTVEPTYTANAFLFKESQNQRSTVRYIENPGSGIMFPATANNGLGFASPTAPALAGTLQVMFIEQ
jgi:hypothetical protein